jgi:hypothetical protein
LWCFFPFIYFWRNAAVFFTHLTFSRAHQPGVKAFPVSTDHTIHHVVKCSTLLNLNLFMYKMQDPCYKALSYIKLKLNLMWLLMILQTRIWRQNCGGITTSGVEKMLPYSIWPTHKS